MTKDIWKTPSVREKERGWLAAFHGASYVFRCSGIVTRDLFDRATGQSNDKDNTGTERIVGNNIKSHNENSEKRRKVCKT